MECQVFLSSLLHLCSICLLLCLQYYTTYFTYTKTYTYRLTLYLPCSMQLVILPHFTQIRKRESMVLVTLALPENLTHSRLLSAYRYIPSFHVISVSFPSPHKVPHSQQISYLNEASSTMGRCYSSRKGSFGNRRARPQLSPTQTDTTMCLRAFLYI